MSVFCTMFLINRYRENFPKIRGVDMQMMDWYMLSLKAKQNRCMKG